MQTTIGKAVGVSGIGLHTGCSVNVQLCPAPVDTGIVFRRVDLQGYRIEALRKYVSRVVLATTLMKKGVMLSTVEHLLSAVYGSGIDNLFVDIDSLELPILDGSALPFVELIQEAGIEEQSREKVYLRIEREFTLESGDKFITVRPWNTLRISYAIDFDHPAIGAQQIELDVNPESYAAEIAFARTFGFYSEVEELLKKGLIRGGSLENAVVLSDSGIMNGELRAPNEFVRHKTLDLIGDVALCGYPVLGHLHAHRAGHALHTDLATFLARDTRVCSRIRESELDMPRRAAAR